MFSRNSRIVCAATAASLLTLSTALVRAAAPLPYSTNFDSDSTATMKGQEGWTFPASPTASPDATAVVTNVAAHSGTQSLLVKPQSGDGNVIKVSTPEFDPSGETPSVTVPAPASSYMATDFWFRSVATTTDTNLYVSTSMGNPASVRNTYLGLFGGSTAGADPTKLYADAISYDASGNELEALSPALAWGAWYHATIAEQYVNGADNDQVTYSIADATGTPVWSTTVGSWEGLYAQGGSEQSPGPVVSDRTTFGGRDDGTTQGVYIDDFSMTNAVPEPASLTLLSAGSLLLVRRRLA